MSRVRTSSKLSPLCRLIIAALFSCSEFSGSVFISCWFGDSFSRRTFIILATFHHTTQLPVTVFVCFSLWQTCITCSFHYILHFHAHTVSSSFPERPALISPLLHSLHPPLSLCSLFDLLPFSLVFLFMYVVSLGLLLCAALSKSINMSGYCGSHSECLVRPCGRRAGLQIYQHTPTQACLSSVITCYWQHRFSNSFFSRLGFSFLYSPYMKKRLLWPWNTV